MHRELSRGLNLQCGCHRVTFLKKGIEMWLSRESRFTVALPAEARIKAWFISTEPSWSERVEGCTSKGIVGLHPAWLVTVDHCVCAVERVCV